MVSNFEAASWEVLSGQIGAEALEFVLWNGDVFSGHVWEADEEQRELVLNVEVNAKLGVSIPYRKKVSLFSIVKAGIRTEDYYEPIFRANSYPTAFEAFDASIGNEVLVRFHDTSREVYGTVVGFTRDEEDVFIGDTPYPLDSIKLIVAGEEKPTKFALFFKEAK